MSQPRRNGLMTLREAIASGARLLSTVPELAGNAVRDAEWLMLDQLSMTRAGLRAHPEQLLSLTVETEYLQRLARRLRCEPIQYIVGHQEFYGLRFKVTPAVLIPRPETELLVESVLGVISRDLPVRLLDVGTGSGAIAIALAVHLPAAAVTALDLSSQALEVARQNAETHGLLSRIRLLQSDLLAEVASERFDVIVSNPPYIPMADCASLHPEVRDFEPSTALFAGDDGLEVYRRLVPACFKALEPGGLLAMEFGYGQQSSVALLLEEWAVVTFYHDLQGIPRVVLARKSYSGSFRSL